jgi:hypothetical protein
MTSRRWCLVGAFSIVVCAVGVPHDAQAAGGGAYLVLVDKSPSMANSNKWTVATQAVVQALDADSFDSMDVGLYSAPTGTVTGPACVMNLPVDCAAPSLAEIALASAGTLKSSAASGVRHDIKAWLVSNMPDSTLPDSMPLYASTQAALAALTSWPGSGPRILTVITDGSPGCGQLASRPGYADCNGCDHEWESPNNLIQLVGNARTTAPPLETFVIGLPGADTADPSGCNAPPYHMRLALSAIAYAGSQPTGCTGTTFTQSGGDPLTVCHYDLSIGSSFNVAAVVNAISAARAAGTAALVPAVPAFPVVGAPVLALALLVVGLLTVARNRVRGRGNARKLSS